MIMLQQLLIQGDNARIAAQNTEVRLNEHARQNMTMQENIDKLSVAIAALQQNFHNA